MYVCMYVCFSFLLPLASLFPFSTVISGTRSISAGSSWSGPPTLRPCLCAFPSIGEVMLLASVSRDFRDFCSSVKLRWPRCTPCLCVILQAHHHKNISSERIKKNNITQADTQHKSQKGINLFSSLSLSLFLPAAQSLSQPQAAESWNL